MYCPNCGRDNSRERKFCASCGTNLEAVSQALSGIKDDFFTKNDTAFDQFIARYTEHVFKDSTSKANDRKVSNSWKILGQGVVTSLVDMFLFLVMWNVIPLRFLILLISTPFRLLSQRSHRQMSDAGAQEDKAPALPESSDRWLPGAFPSVSENTTQHLEERLPPGRKQAADRE